MAITPPIPVPFSSPQTGDTLSPPVFPVKAATSPDLSDPSTVIARVTQMAQEIANMVSGASPQVGRAVQAILRAFLEGSQRGARKESAVPPAVRPLVPGPSQAPVSPPLPAAAGAPPSLPPEAGLLLPLMLARMQGAGGPPPVPPMLGG